MAPSSMKTMDQTTTSTIQRLPMVGETVELKCLISSPHLNGKRGEISTYVCDPDMHRYRVNILMEDGTRQVIGVRPQNISLIANSNSNNQNVPSRVNRDDAIHVLVPCHVDTERTCAQFRQCVKSLSCQNHERCTIIVYVSGPEEYRQDAFYAMRKAAVSGRGESNHRWIVVEDEDEGPASASVASTTFTGEAGSIGFRQWKMLSSVSMDVNPNAWLMFLENRDIYHPLRIQFFQESIRNLRQNNNSGELRVFSAGGKLLVDDSVASANLGTDAVLNMEDFLEGTSGDLDGDALKGVTEISNENKKWNPLEYFDYCVQTDFFKEFLESERESISSSSHQPAFNIKFIEAITKVSPPPPHFRHSQQSWLYVHYRNQCFSNTSNGRSNIKKG